MLWKGRGCWKQFHAGGTERAERNDRTNFTINHKNDDKTTLQYGIVWNIRPKADLSVLFD